jgi:hypothetical protein
MTKRIPASGSQKMMVLIHMIVYAIAVVIMWTTYDKGHTRWTYPWPAWITAAWGLGLIGHLCIVFRSYEDKGLKTYQDQDRGN